MRKQKVMRKGLHHVWLETGAFSRFKSATDLNLFSLHDHKFNFHIQGVLDLQFKKFAPFLLLKVMNLSCSRKSTDAADNIINVTATLRCLSKLELLNGGKVIKTSICAFPTVTCEKDQHTNAKIKQ